MPLDSLSPEDVEEFSALAEQKLFAKTPKENKLVKTQRELVRAIKDGDKKIYLCGGEFWIPLNRNGVTYVGCDNAVIDLDEELDVDFDKCEIVLEDVQVYLHHPINIKAEQSHNVKIIDGSKKVLGERPTLKEIAEVIRGKNAFETPEDFKARVEKLCGVEVKSLSDLSELFGGKQRTFTHVWGYKKVFREDKAAADKFCSDCAKRIAHDFPTFADEFARLPITGKYFA